MRHIFILKCLGVAAIEVTMIMSQRGNRDSNFLQAFKLAIQGPLIFTLDSPFLRRDKWLAVARGNVNIVSSTEGKVFSHSI